MPLDRLLCLILPLVQIVTSFVWPLLGLGQPIAQMAYESRTPVVPAGYAFVIWTPIFITSVAYGVWQALPAQRDDRLAQALAWPLVVVFGANSLWQSVAPFTANGFHLVLILLASLAAALVALFRLRRTPDDGGIGRFLAKVLVGVLAGWLTAAAFVNISGAARASNFIPADGFGATLGAVLVVLAAGGFAAAVTWLVRGDLYYVGAVAWALAAIIVANLGFHQVQPLVVAAAGGMLALVAVIAVARRRGDPGAAADPA